MNQNQIKQMTDALFKELIRINQESTKDGRRRTNEEFMNDLQILRIQNVTKQFVDPKTLNHYLKRIKNMMNSEDENYKQ